MVARRATHEGVGDMHIAEIENFSAPVDGDELNRMVRRSWEQAGSG